VPFLKRNGYVPEGDIYAIENPLPDRFIGRDVTVEGRPKRVGYCGSWIPRKGTEVMKVDIAEFLRRYPSWTFSVVGSQGVDVKQGFPDDVRGQIEVTPFMERKNLIDWYHSLSILTLPSIYESFGLVVAEAMACGAAVVTTNVGFAHGLTHEEEAYILSEPASPLLMEALTELITREDLRRTLATNGYERVQSLRWEKAIDRLEQIYRTLADE
jgi:glycosyltransferase involved in cell wall biosynthesis